MRYSLRFRPAARREYLALSKKGRAQIAARLDRLAQGPHLPGTEPLHGDLKGRRKLWVGRCRVVYSVETDALVVRVIAVGRRGRG